MFRGQFVRPLELTPRNQPAGTLAENASEPISTDEATAQLHGLLIRSNPHIISKERLLFLTYCAPCHGRDGRGDGSVREVLMVPPTDLINGQSSALSDGNIFSVIRDGVKAMPPYGDTLAIEETWEVVAYVRYLQGRPEEQQPSP
jgi:cytochrome c553